MKAKHIYTFIHAIICSLIAIALTSCESKTERDESIVIVDDIYEVNYTAVGGIQPFVMYSDLGEWELLPTYEEDWEWVTAWPKRGSGCGRFSVKVSENKTAYPRSCELNIVSSGKVISTITFNQEGTTPSLEINYPSDTKLVSALGEQFKIRVSANIEWHVEIPEGASWLSCVEKTDTYQIFGVEPNPTTEERRAPITFVVPGTSISKPLLVKQAKPSESFADARQVTVADILSMTGDGAGTIEENVYVKAYVVSDYTSGNFPAAQMCVQDESNKGLCIEFDDEDSNDYPLGSLLTIHLYGCSTALDPETKAPRFVNFSRTMIMKSEDSDGIAPVVLDDASQLGEYEHALVTLRNVEYVLPYGTYLNMTETVLNQDYGTYDISKSLPYSERNNEYIQLLRDSAGNVAELYTFHSSVFRAARMIPEGSGDITGVVMRRYKHQGTVYHIRMRSLSDDKVSDDASTRMSTTVMQIGPWTEYAKGLSKVLASVGTGQLRESASGDAVAVNSNAGNASMYFGPSWTRNRAAELINGEWIPLYANSIVVQYYCIIAQDWWSNNYNRIEDWDGVAWIIHTSTAGHKGQLSLAFATASSSSGPLVFTLEWSTSENTPLADWKYIGQYYAANTSTSQGMKLYTIDLPEACCDRGDLVLRMRVAKDQRAKGTSSTIDNAGTNRIGIIRISER